MLHQLTWRGTKSFAKCCAEFAPNIAIWERSRHISPTLRITDCDEIFCSAQTKVASSLLGHRLDFAFGTTMRWGHGKPLFYPDRPLNYQANGYAAPLPARAGELLDWIDGLPRQEVARIFSLSEAEANDLQARCSKVGQLGLAAAIARERFWQRKDGFLIRWRERAYAQFAKSLMALAR